MVHGSNLSCKSVLLMFLWLSCGGSCLLADGKKADQKPAEAKQGKEGTPFTFKVPVDVVVVNVTASDKKGNPALDLTSADFKVFEDGKPQLIHTFALESYKAVQELDTDEKKAGGGTAEPVPAVQPRLISVVIDDITASANDRFYQATEALRKFVEKELGPGDQMAIVAASGRVQYPFTNSKELLLDEIGGLYKKLNVALTDRSICPTLTDMQAQQIFNRTDDQISLRLAIEETINCARLNRQDAATPQIAESMARQAASAQYHETQNRNRTLLYSLRQHIRALRHFEARKLLVLFSDGFCLQDLTYELQDVVDVALRAAVVLNTLDIRGLYTTNVTAEATLSDVPPALMGWKQSLLLSDKQAQEDPLHQLAYDTGGVFFHSNNDLLAGLQKIFNRQAYSYVLTYAAPSLKSDGRYHKIKLEVSRPGIELSYRKGYYSPKEQLTYERRKKEDIMEALQAPGNLNEIPVTFSYNYYQLEDSRYEVALLTTVNISALRFLQEESRHKNLLNLIVIALDENDHYIDGLEKSVDFSLTSPSYSELLTRGFISKVDLKLSPGRYKIRAVVRESVQSKMGSITKLVEIP